MKVAVLLVLSSLALAQQSAITSAPCSPIAPDNIGTITINCSGISKEQGTKMLVILNKILANKIDSDAVIAKLNEITKIDASSGVLLSPTSAGPLKFQLGDSEPHDMSEGVNFVVPLAKESALTIAKVGNRIEVSTEIRDASGKMVAKIEKNEWQLKPSLLWDRNYNDTALEIEDDTGNVILQVVLLPDRVKLQGIWRSESGACTEIANIPSPDDPGRAIMAIPTLDACRLGNSALIKINPIFVYPSSRHLGELKKP